MEVIIQPTAQKAAFLTAFLIARKIRKKPDAVLGLATGRTMERVYDDLIELYTKQGLDFSLCRSFNLDEYVGVSPASQQSYRYYMNQRFFTKINIRPENTNLPDSTADDLQKECMEYEKKIKAAGGIDLQLLGIGNDGHIGFNEPLSSLASRTRDKTLS